VFHAEVINKVGAMIGGLTYGAKAASAESHIKTALKLTPNSPIAHVEHANVLLLLKGAKGEDAAADEYEKATKLKPVDSMEKLDQFQLPDQEQGEGIAVDHDRTLLLSSEGVHSDVLRVPLPAAAASSPAPTASPTARTEPHQETELGETTQTQRSAWPWLLGGVVGLGMVLVLTLSLRRR